MNTLLYISYGEGPHEKEVIFSILSASLQSNPLHYQVLIYTDHPKTFEHLDAEVHFVSPDEWSEWSGSKNFAHRRKILALQHAMKTSGSPIVLVDGDTWFRKPVDKVFERVRPGRTVMHIREGKVSEVTTPVYQALNQLLTNAQLEDREGQKFRISPQSSMWNAGVVGLHPVDGHLLDDVLHLTDQFCEQSELHVLEQFAFSFVLSSQTHLDEVPDLIFHYWPAYLHVPFREKLDGLFEEAKNLPVERQGDFLFAQRPRPSWPRRMKVFVKKSLQKLGLIKGRIRSNEL